MGISLILLPLIIVSSMRQTCSKCNGSGVMNKVSKKICNICRANHDKMNKCWKCNGQGILHYVDKCKCNMCNGKGFTSYLMI